MTLDDRAARAVTLVDSTSGLSIGQLRSFLDRECANDPALRAEVERLIVERETFVDPRHEPGPSASLVREDIVAGHYRIVRLIGRGGMGEVYEAEDLLLKERVALKTIRADLAGRDALLLQFQEEVLLARKVTHPNVCRIYEVGMHSPSGRAPLLFFAMELLEGETLASRIRSRPLTRDEAFPLIVQLAEGLQAAHDAGVVHADFKSGNIVLARGADGVRAVITDFGLARLDPSASVNEGRTLAEVRLAGTVAYMSPEQLRGDRITAASDIYSFGVVLFEMAAGTLPFDDRDLIKAAMLKASGEPIPVRTRVPDIDHRWEVAIDRCLEKDPERRFASADALAAWFTDHRWFEFSQWTPRDWVRAIAATILALTVSIAGWMWSTRPYRPLPAAQAAYDAGMGALHSMTYEAARKAFEGAVAADPKFALAHASLARAYDELDYTDRAKDSMLRALAAAQETRLTDEDERRLRATQFAVSRDYERAAPLFREMEAAASASERPAAALETGWLAQQMDDSDAAKAAFERALALNPSYAAARLRLGFMLGRQGGKDDLALAAFTEAEHLYSDSGDKEGVTETLWNRANLLNRRSRAADAMPVIDAALDMTRSVGNRYQEIRLQFLQGTALRNLGQTALAAERARLAIEAAAAENMDNLATNGQIDLGNIYLSSGNYEVAEPYFRRALDTARRAKVRRLEARGQLAMASLCEQDHRPEEARAFAEAGLAFYRQAGYQRESVQAAVVLGGVLQQLGQNDDSIRVLRETLPKAERLQDKRTQAQLRERLGENLRDQGQLPSALAEYANVIALYGSLEQAERVRVASARLQWSLGLSEDAERSLKKAQDFELHSRSPRLAAELALARAEIAYDEGHMSEAVRFTQQATAAKGDEELQRQATLVRAMTMIRTGRAREGAAAAGRVLDALQSAHLNGAVASTRLALASAFAFAGQRPEARAMAEAALAYFEPRNAWESVWRSHAIAAMVADAPAEATTHVAAGRLALAQLQANWGAEPVRRYMARGDIKRL
jgi:tetratricopeptide (TPR) repeat protein